MNPLLLGPLLDIGSKLVERLFPDPKAADAAKLELFKMQQSGELAQLAADTDLAKGQLAVNTEEAKSQNVFIAGWRPFIGWTCGAAFAYKFVLGPVLYTAYTAYVGKPLLLPVIDTTEMMPVLLGMLGLGALRTVEKVKGAA